MTFSEAFYGTYKIDKHDGKPHLKERLYHPFDDFWSGILIFCGAVGCIIFLLQFASQLQLLRGFRMHPEHYDPVTWQTFYIPISCAAALIPSFLALALPRWFRCKGAMHISLILSLLILSAAQVASHYLLSGEAFTFSLETLGTVLSLVLSSALTILLYACAVCFVSAGLTALVNLLIAKYRMHKAK